MDQREQRDWKIKLNQKHMQKHSRLAKHILTDNQAKKKEDVGNQMVETNDEDP